MDVAASQAEWRATRTYLNANRYSLADDVRRLYAEVFDFAGLRTVAKTALLGTPAWTPCAPIPLEDVALEWVAESDPAEVTGSEPESETARPFRSPDVRFSTYSETMGELDRPRLFENRPAFRLLDADLAGGRPTMRFGRAYYFDGVNVGEALAHEFAAASQDERFPDWQELPFRMLVGDPVDAHRRPVLPAISALTLRRAADGECTFLLHWRDPAKVAHGGGLYQVMPVGVFQPSSGSVAAEKDDFDLWRCIVRELSEEFLGGSEQYGTPDAAFDYDAWPFYRVLTQARDAGRVRSHVLGMGVDPLTMATDLLVVSVLDAEVFDQLFADTVATNEEGTVVGSGKQLGLSFAEDTVERFAGREPMQAAGAAVLRLAWEQRGMITRLT